MRQIPRDLPRTTATLTCVHPLQNTGCLQCVAFLRLLLLVFRIAGPRASFCRSLFHWLKVVGSSYRITCPNITPPRLRRTLDDALNGLMIVGSCPQMQRLCHLRQTLRRGRTELALDRLVACTRTEGNTVVAPGHIRMGTIMTRRMKVDAFGFPILKTCRIRRRRWT